MKYDMIGHGYRRYRTPDPQIAAMVSATLGNAETILNVGAGTGSYEPKGRRVTAVEPSATMIDQRAPGSAPAVQASAESLPFDADSFDAAMSILTIHHWRDWESGLAEMRRVAFRVVILTWDPADQGFWLTRDYLPELIDADRNCFPSMNEIMIRLPGAMVKAVPIPADCPDGFLGAYWRRPSAYLDASRRQVISTFSRISDVSAGLAQLSEDLRTGVWEDRNYNLLSMNSLDLGYRIILYERSPSDPSIAE